MRSILIFIVLVAAVAFGLYAGSNGFWIAGWQPDSAPDRAEQSSATAVQPDLPPPPPPLVIAFGQGAVAQDLLKNLAFQTKISLEFVELNDQDQLAAQIAGSSKPADLAIIPHQMVDPLIAAGALQVWPEAALPLKAKIDPRFLLVPGDPEAQYVLPILWGSIGFAIDTQQVKDFQPSLKTLFAPPARLAGKVGLMDRPMDVINLAAIYAGVGINPTNKTDLARLRQILSLKKPPFQMLPAHEAEQRLVDGVTAIEMTWNNTAMRARLTKSSIRYVQPKEGQLMWLEVLAIPLRAQVRPELLVLLEKWIGPDQAAAQMMATGHSSTILGVKDFLPEPFRSAPELQISEESPVYLAPLPPAEAAGAPSVIWAKRW